VFDANRESYNRKTAKDFASLQQKLTDKVVVKQVTAAVNGSQIDPKKRSTIVENINDLATAILDPAAKALNEKPTSDQPSKIIDATSATLRFQRQVSVMIGGQGLDANSTVALQNSIAAAVKDSIQDVMNARRSAAAEFESAIRVLGQATKPSGSDVVVPTATATGR
jgi:hypothetical protein